MSVIQIDPVAQPIGDQTEMERLRKLPRLLMKGTRAMREAGKEYLPQFPAESDDAWKARRDCAVLYPGFRDAVELASSLIFRREVEEGEGVPEAAAEWLDDIDLTGRDVTQFAQEVFKDALPCGISYILVDYPRLTTGLTLAQEQALKARPYFVHIRSEQVLGWRTRQINGRPVLTQFRYLECLDLPDGDYGEKEQRQVRVLEPFMVQVYVETKGQDGQTKWILDPEQSGATTTPEVMVVPVYTGRCEPWEAHPPLEDLAWKNVQHWQSASDQTVILHTARVPLLAVIGGDENKSIFVSTKAAIMLPVNSDVKYVEHSGAAIAAGEADLERLKTEMQHMAGRMLDTGNVKTALEAGVESTQAMSRIQAWACGLNQALNQAWTFAGQLCKQDLGELAVNTDLDTSKPDAALLTELRNATVAGLLSKETYLKVLNTSEVLPEGFDLQEELDRIAKEAPDLPPIPPRKPAGAGGQPPPAKPAAAPPAED